MKQLRTGLVLAAVLGATLMLSRVALDRPVDAVRVEGVLTLAERAAVRTVLTDRLRSGLLSLDLDAVIDSVQALSWPQVVRVRRVWPSTLVVSVVKQEPVALWGDGRYLTSNGRVVKLADAPDNLPRLLCMHSTPAQALEVYQRLAQSAEWAGERMVRLDENSLGEWRAHLSAASANPGIAVMLGAGGARVLQHRLHRFFTVRNGLPAERADALRYADVRYTNGVALRFEPASMLATGH